MSEPIHELRPRQALQERVASAIVEAAARVLAERGEQASMTDVAAEAGVARATVYRYFPSRDALLSRVGELAVADAGARLASARIGEVAPEEGLTRAVRALVDIGDLFIVLARERIRTDREQFEAAVGGPLRQVFERGQAAGAFRGDISPSWLVEALVGLIASALGSTPKLGREDTTAAISSMFLEGARRQEFDRRREDGHQEPDGATAAHRGGGFDASSPARRIPPPEPH